MYSSIEQTAEKWRLNGISPLPCYPRTKRAMVPWSRWQHMTPPAAIVSRWFSNPAVNLALVTGTGHETKLVVLDFDSLPSYLQFRDSHAIARASYTVSTARGAHVYLWVAGDIATQHADAIDCDIRASGAYVMAPPSIHPNGKPYTIVNDAPIIELDKSEFATLIGEPASTLHHTPVPPPILSAPVLQPTCDLIAEIKAQMPILNLIARYSSKLLPSDRSGRWFVARCVFPANHLHGDSNPSMWVDAHRNICGCFRPTCRAKHGGRPMDVINLYTLVNHLTNAEAIHALADELGLFDAIPVPSGTFDVSRLHLHGKDVFER